MNFLLHRHLAERDLGSAAAGLGAMLPDLWRMADRRMRAKRSVAAAEPASDAFSQLLEGIEHHLEVDAWFHGHPVFTDGLEACHEALSGYGDPKLRLFGHVVWEMCLDGALVRRRGPVAAVEDLRRSLEAADEHDLSRAAGLHRPSLGHQPVVSEALWHRLRDLFRSLREGGWITGYADGDGLVARLDGVRQRFDLPAVRAATRPSLVAAFEQLLELAETRLDELLAYREGD